jgi:broad specificity phosphatase PhoE
MVLCSPLRRARETCEEAGFGDRAVFCDELREWDYGDYEGLTTAEIRTRDPGWDLWRDGCPGGERPGQVGARVDRMLALVPGVGHVVIFAHGHVLRVMAARWLQLEPSAGARFALGPGAVSVLGQERETRVVLGWNASGRDELFVGDALPGRARA